MLAASRTLQKKYASCVSHMNLESKSGRQDFIQGYQANELIIPGASP
jgi:hypothetical protein